MTESVSPIGHWADDGNMIPVLKHQFLVFLLLGRLIGLHMSMKGGINKFPMTTQRKGELATKKLLLMYQSMQQVSLEEHMARMWGLGCGGWERGRVLPLRAWSGEGANPPGTSPSGAGCAFQRTRPVP